MLNKIKKSKLEKSERGFTIIEVMIVLVIAGLILLIVFLAVPALQRNSRNTQRKNDVSRVGSSVQTALDNNNGLLTGVTSANVQNELGNLAYYTNTNVQVQTPIPATNNTTVDTVHIYTGANCNGGNPVAGTTRQIAITYSTEQGGGGINHLCVAQ